MKRFDLREILPPLEIFAPAGRHGRAQLAVMVTGSAAIYGAVIAAAGADFLWWVIGGVVWVLTMAVGGMTNT